MNILYIFWLRHVKRYVRSRSRIVGALGQPLMYLAALGFGLGPVFQKAGQGSYVEFLAPGVLAMSILFTAVFNGGDVIWDRQFGILKSTLVAPVPRFLIMLGRTLGGATIATTQGLLVLIVCLIAGFRPVHFSVLPFAFVFMVMTALLFTTLGIGFACYISDFPGFQLVINFLVMPMFLLSGALYPLNDVSPVLKAIAIANPLAYGVDGMRAVLIGGSMHLFSVTADLAVLTAVSAILLTAGAYSFSRIQL
jgi:ABC-2 type transport system permease protein